MHLHAPDEQAVICQETKVGIKREARDQIVSASLVTVSEGTAVKMPRLDSLKRTIQRQRVRHLAAPAQPTSLEQLVLPAEYQLTAKGEQFLLYDSGPDTQRMLIFGTQRNLEMLKLAEHWMADGTFKTAPPLFSQVYVVHALRGGAQLMRDGHLLPSLFVLLPNKTEATYRRMWEQIRLLCPLAQPKEMLLDFEKAAINSFEQVWPETVVKCCFFHPTQNVCRKVQAAGMQADDSQDEELAIRIRQLPALAFAHPYDVHELFAEVAQQLPMAQATELVLYFERTYIGRTLPGGTHQAPLFPLNLWNYYYETPFGLPRTTNAVEAWHRSFNATVGCHHPSIWKFIAALKREQGLIEVRLAKFIAVAPPISLGAD